MRKAIALVPGLTVTLWDIEHFATDPAGLSRSEAGIGGSPVGEACQKVEAYAGAGPSGRGGIVLGDWFYRICKDSVGREKRMSSWDKDI